MVNSLPLVRLPAHDFRRPHLVLGLRCARSQPQGYGDDKRGRVAGTAAVRLHGARGRDGDGGREGSHFDEQDHLGGVIRQPASEHTDAEASRDWLAPAAMLAAREDGWASPFLQWTVQEMVQLTGTLQPLSSLRMRVSSREASSSCEASTQSAGGALPSAGGALPLSSATVLITASSGSIQLPMVQPTARGWTKFPAATIFGWRNVYNCTPWSATRHNMPSLPT